MKYVKLLILSLIFVLLIVNTSIAINTLTEPTIATGDGSAYHNSIGFSGHTVITYSSPISCSYPVTGQCVKQTTTYDNCGSAVVASLVGFSRTVINIPKGDSTILCGCTDSSCAPPNLYCNYFIDSFGFPTYYEYKFYNGDMIDVPFRTNTSTDIFTCNTLLPGLAATIFSGPPINTGYLLGPVVTTLPHHYVIMYRYLTNYNYDLLYDDVFTHRSTTTISASDVKTIITSTEITPDINISDGVFSYTRVNSTPSNSLISCANTITGNFAFVPYAKLWNDTNNIGGWGSFYVGYYLLDWDLGNPKIKINYFFNRNSIPIQITKSFDAASQTCSSAFDIRCAHHLLLPSISGIHTYGNGTFFLTETPLP
jgi:hypothetical protein